MTTVVERDDIQTSHQARSWVRRAVPAVLVVALVTGLGVWWFQGGVFVSATQGSRSARSASLGSSCRSA